MNYTNINVPLNFKIILIKNGLNTLIILLNEKKKFKINIRNSVFIDKWSNSIIIKNKKIFYITKSNKFLNFFLKSLYKYFYKKIKFKGKGFRIKNFKKIKLIKFYFGKSHKTFINLKNINKKRINKYKIIFFSINKKLNSIKNIIKNIRKLNQYTIRGLRISRQIIFKRKGKKGTYI